MPVKPAAGEVVEQTTRTRIVSEADPAADGGGKRQRPPFWDYVRLLTAEQWSDNPGHTLYLYRWDKETGEYALVEKYTQGPFTEDLIQKEHGGGKFKILMRRGPQLIYNIEPIPIEGMPRRKDGSGFQTGGGASSGEMGALAMTVQALVEELRAARGGNAAQSAIQGAVDLNRQIFASGAEALRTTLNNPQAAAPSANEALMAKFMEAMIMKMMNPTDPIETFAKMVTAMNGLGLGAAKTPAASIGVEITRGLMQNLPSVAAHISGIMANYAAVEAARTRREEITRGVRTVTMPAVPAAQPAAQAAVQPPPEPAPSNVVQMPAPAAPAPSDPELLFQYIESKVVELLRDEGITAEEAADMALKFMDVTDANIVDQLLIHGEQGLRWAFANRTVLKQVPPSPRLEAFIKAFVEGGAKVQVPAVDPNIPPA